jgi:mono/diheme cytochrome c family protein
MRKLGRILGWVFIGLLLLAGAAITFTIGWRPFVGPRSRALTSRTFEPNPTRLARGEYLVKNVTDCMDCHADHDWSAHDAPLRPSTLGAGQDMNLLKGFPGKVYAPNITPDRETGAGTWSDDQLARAIREGVGHDGRALFPFMPFEDFRALSDEDLASIIVYIRSIPPIRQQRPPTDLIFPVKYLIRTVPEPLEAPVAQADLSTAEKRGKYLVTIAGCTDCHTPQDDKGQPIAGLEFAGGFVLDGPWGRVASANITQDPSGIPYYDDALFMQVMRTGYVKARKINQIMPWHTYRGMTDEDLAAVFAYVKTFKPVPHHVDNSAAPTYCKLCRQSHGGANVN